MFHVKPGEGVLADGRADEDVFGDRLTVAERYAEMLATDGVERGLLGPREVPRIWDRHVLNSAVVQELIEPGVRVVDVGSGAGLPGIPVAIARPDLRVTLVEPLLRRATFLHEVVAELGLDVTVHRGRAEEATTRRAVGGSAVVVSRAVAPLGKLMAWCLPLAAPGGRALALKGRSADVEVARDGEQVRRAGGSAIRVVECGTRVCPEPTTVVEVTRRTRR